MQILLACAKNTTTRPELSPSILTKPKFLEEADYAYANNHLWICSFLYGLLRPMDRSKNYRLEGNVKLPNNDNRNMFDFWKPRLTDVLIDSVKQDDGCLGASCHRGNGPSVRLETGQTESENPGTPIFHS